jgi:phospholipase/lecithinase/hemolysin
MKRVFSLIVLNVFFLYSSLGAAQETFSNIYVFGDSLSDTGNLASVTEPFPDPPYNDNRVTNGKVAVEILAENMGLSLTTSLHLIGVPQGNNYAVADARAAGQEPIDLPTQVNAFLQAQQNQVPSDALYVVFIGSNDVRDARDAESRVEASSGIREAVDGVDSNIRALIAAGATHFLVVNVPDIGNVPETQILAEAGGEFFLPRLASFYSKWFNLRLKNKVRKLRDEFSVKMVLFDLEHVFDEYLRYSDAYSIINDTDACFLTAQQQFNVDCEFALFNSFAYFDEVHPTAVLHQHVGEIMSVVRPKL